MTRRLAVAHPGRVLLVGLMAVGKSTVGRLLAGRLDARYLDNDNLVASAVGATKLTLLARDGVAALREAESAALGVALAAVPPVVAGIAAGVVDAVPDRARLAAADATVAWLRARPATLAARVASLDPAPGDGGGDGGGAGTAERPWLRPDPLAAFTTMQSVRGPFYAEVSDLVCDVDDADADRIAERIECFVRARMATAG